MTKLITTDSQFNTLPILIKELKGKVNSLDGKNLIFCEEKISLMVERSITTAFKGSFNTAVYSFGNYLRAKRNCQSALTKEGSAMAVKRVLSSASLNCFKASRTTLAPALYDLIIQLKSAKVTPSDLTRASEYSFGTLKNKLKDIASVYEGYEKFILERGLDDQSSILNYLPELILNDQEIAKADVYILGFSGITRQIRSAISALLKTAKSVTAILVEGENELAFVNETPSSFRELVKDAGLSLEYKNYESDWTKEGKTIAYSLFNPKAFARKKQETDKIFTLSAQNKAQECERVGEVIRQKVISGECRYRDITVALPDTSLYAGDIERAFNMLEIPYFLDQKKKASAHPLIRLILSYIDATRKNLERKALSEFYKNALFCSDKRLSDEFENYVLEYNIDYYRIKKPFTFGDSDRYDLVKLNEFRERIVNCFTYFNPKKLLVDLDVKNLIDEYSNKLFELGEMEERAVNDQIYSAVERILDEIDKMLGGVELPLIEFRNVFLSGVSAMEISIIPQYNDAVFVGGLKETSLAKAKYLFVLGLTSDVPQVKEDIALLNDGDLTLLEDVRVLVEPKIRVVNHRVRENTALALSAFADGLYLSYPLVGVDGEKLEKSSALTQIESAFNLKPFPQRQGYLARKQGLSAFARDCGDFAQGKMIDGANFEAFYEVEGREKLKPLMDRSNKAIELKLKSSTQVANRDTISPSRIENYHACPYKAFLSDTLNIQPRKEGQLDHLSTGNIAHAIFEKYLRDIDKVSDKETSDRLVGSLAKELLDSEEYAKFLSDEVNSAATEKVVSEVGKFCYINYLARENSSFKQTQTEATFGFNDKDGYPAIEFAGGKVKMRGKVDRVDEYDDYYRVIDYKTGKATADLDKLFSGNKLQLYLYAKAISQGKSDKELAGVYYMPIKDEYRSQGSQKPPLVIGYTLNDAEIIEKQDAGAVYKKGVFLPTCGKQAVKEIKGAVSQDLLKAFIDYAMAVSDKAVERMREGVIAPSPISEKICDYCDYKALCPFDKVAPREVLEVDESVIAQSVKEKDEGNTNE